MLSIGIFYGYLGSFKGNHSLLSLTGLDNVASIGEGITIVGNMALTSLTGFSNVSSIAGNFLIKHNPNLANFTGMDNVTSIGGNLYIAGNPVLTSLTALYNVTSIGGSLFIGNPPSGIGNDSLINLTGLDNVTSIGGDITIGGNDALTSLTGLENITYIEGDLTIGWWYDEYSEAGNDALVNLTGLDNVISIEGDLSIKNNDALSICEIQSICNYLASPNGTIEIYDNAVGCNSQQELEEACDALSGIEIFAAENYSIYPNPVNDMATFSSEDIISFELCDMAGTLITKRNSNNVDMSNLNQGIYFVTGFDKHDKALYKGRVIKK